MFTSLCEVQFGCSECILIILFVTLLNVNKHADVDVNVCFVGETPSRTLAETATERARETALAAKEKAKGLASHAQKKQYV